MGWPAGKDSASCICRDNSCIAYKENMLPISAETALQALKLPVSNPWPYTMVLTNYGINMPGKGRQLSQRIGNVIKQGMFFSLNGRSTHLNGQCCRNKLFRGVGRGGEGHCSQKPRG